jgi:hypothetical protein
MLEIPADLLGRDFDFGDHRRAEASAATRR